MNEKVAYSSLKLVFGKCEYWFQDDSLTWELSELPDISYFQDKESEKIAKSLFWRNLSSKIYQVDNFSYDGIASIEFEKQLGRYKINFNPLTFYEFVIYCGASSLGLNLPNFSKEPFEQMVSILENNKDILTVYGWNADFYKFLKSNGWNKFECWQYWNNLIHKNTYIFDSLLYVFVHEMMHLIWDHVNRMKKSEDMTLWNVAADFSINQNLKFPMPLKKKLVTQFSDFFWKEAQYAFLKYFSKTNEIQISQKIKKLLENKDDFFVNKDDKLINKILDFNKNQFIHNKNADFYFDIFREADSSNKKQKESSEGSGSGSEEIEGLFKHIQSDSTEPDNDNGAEFDKKIKQIEANKIFRESFNSSEDKKLNKNAVTTGKSEIPLSFLFQEKIDNLLKVKKDNRWKKEFHRFFLSCINEKEKDMTMTRSSRKRPDIFPGLKRDIGLDIVFIIDTSGSISKANYKQFIGEIVNINKICELDKCRIIQCHTIVSSDDRKFSLKKIKSIVFKESGGTRMRTALDILVKEKNKKPVVIFTDGEIDYFAAEEFKFKILLFVTNSHTVYDLNNRGFRTICPQV